MKRSSPLPRRRKPLTRSPVKRVNRARQKREKPRQYGSAAFKDHVHSSPCLWCGVRRPIEQAHCGKDGTMKGDWTETGPLCGAFRVGSYAYPGCHARNDRREMPKGFAWLTDSERAELAKRQAKFIADWKETQ